MCQIQQITFSGRSSEWKTADPVPDQWHVRTQDRVQRQASGVGLRYGLVRARTYTGKLEVHVRMSLRREINNNVYNKYLTKITALS